MNFLTRLNDFYIMSKWLFKREIFKEIKAFDQCVIVNAANVEYVCFSYKHFDREGKNLGLILSFEEVEAMVKGQATFNDVIKEQCDKNTFDDNAVSLKDECVNNWINQKRITDAILAGQIEDTDHILIDLDREKQLMDTYVYGTGSNRGR